MSTMAAFVLGLLVGWVIEWIIDWVYWRRKGQPEAGMDQTATRLAQTEAVLKKSDLLRADLEQQLTALKASNTALQEKVNGLEADKLAMSGLAASRQAAVPAVPDDLIIINGIGPVIAKKLNDAGIFTFRDLGALTPDGLRAIVGEAIQRLADEDDILDQARRLAAERDEAENL